MTTSFGVSETIGRRDKMEDRYVVKNSDLYSLYGVFDGHGGDKASEFVKTYFEGYRLNKVYPDIVAEAKRFKEIILGIHELSNGQVGMSGTTLSLILIYKKLKKMIVVNVGDSRTMVLSGNEGLIITEDHNVNTNRRDVLEIQKRGGQIVDGYVHRKQQGGVNLTRAIGDHEFPELIRHPDIYIVDLDTITHIVLSCDGMWEKTTLESVTKIVSSKLGPKAMSKRLVEKAFADGSGDNITAMVIKL